MGLNEWFTWGPTLLWLIPYIYSLKVIQAIMQGEHKEDCKGRGCESEIEICRERVGQVLKSLKPSELVTQIFIIVKSSGTLVTQWT